MPSNLCNRRLLSAFCVSRIGYKDGEEVATVMEEIVAVVFNHRGTLI